jgi:hypothetical protein
LPVLKQESNDMTQPDPLELVRQALRLGERVGQPGPECLEDDLLAALADGGLPTSERNQAMLHLSRCARCRGAVASLARALADPAVAGAKAAADRAPRRRFIRLAVPAAAAAVLFVAVLGRQGEDDRPSRSHRAPGITAADQPVAIAPLGAGIRPKWLHWRSVVGADLYRVTLFHSDGRVIYERELRDTAVALPDSIGLAARASYLWKVEARTSWHRWSSSRLVEFSITGDPSS